MTTTPRHFERELADLQRALISMGDLVQRSLTIACETIVAPRVEAREQARVIEEQLDALETGIDERIQQLIALQQPMARDLRLMIAAMRITADLEQIGDHAESVAKRATWIARHGDIASPPALPVLAQLARRMVREAMDEFLNGGRDTARTIITEEDESDLLTKQCYEAIQQAMAARPDRIREYTHLLRAVAHLESIADLAVSIAEEGVFLHHGTVIRHSHEVL